MNVKSYEDTLAFLSSYVRPAAETEIRKLSDALGFVLAENLISNLDLPRFNNSAMDGWAFGSENIQPESFTLTCVGSAFAGHPYEGKLRPGECIRIMTGAEVPEGADTVVKQEIVTSEGSLVTFPAGVRKNENVRFCGEEVQQGSVCLKAGIKLRSAHMNFLAAVGVKEVVVYRKLKVGFFSTGDELIGVEETISEGKIYDSNRYCIKAMIEEAGFEPVDFGRFPDNEQKIKDGVLQAAVLCDAIITSGGVSVGEADFTRDAVLSNGELVDWKCLIKPGKPLAIGKVRNAYFFGLPGNPTAAQVTFHAIVSLALRRLSGEINPTLKMSLAYAGADNLKKKPGYTEFQRGVLEVRNGRICVIPAGSQKTGAMRSMVDANCFIFLPEQQGAVHEGDLLRVVSFYGLYS
ncbi:gephyrin-like molybdotransferase Glp [uncultured Parasutterella sp.]|uniref:molybdopterin molybdotransferase MoeA n=1 Tax=uncultured Parasutterella sp. TaxID=1263098 RepID=UPI00272DC328|nr:gephyrin-like molybdotransferase Glp [uncultured Parasutterella sp.]